MNRIAAYTQAKSILELGTSLGISSSYLAASENSPNVFTLEGDKQSHEIASTVFAELDLGKIEPILGRFSETLVPTLKKIKTVDLVFIDGHHNKDSTLEYFETIKKYCHDESVIIVDDIYWSKGMNEAWEIIKAMPHTSMSIDLFFCGLIFFNKSSQRKKHFKIRPDKILFHR